MSKIIIPNESSETLGFKNKDVKIGKHLNEGPKEKGVSSEPHPLDRRSGTGRGKEVSKGGHGKNNWGTFKDDLRSADDVDDQDQEQDQNGKPGTTINPEQEILLAPKKNSKELHIDDEQEFPSLK